MNDVRGGAHACGCHDGMRSNGEGPEQPCRCPGRRHQAPLCRGRQQHEHTSVVASASRRRRRWLDRAPSSPGADGPLGVTAAHERLAGSMGGLVGTHAAVSTHGNDSGIGSVFRSTYSVYSGMIERGQRVTKGDSQLRGGDEGLLAPAGLGADGSRAVHAGGDLGRAHMVRICADQSECGGRAVARRPDGHFVSARTCRRQSARRSAVCQSMRYSRSWGPFGNGRSGAGARREHVGLREPAPSGVQAVEGCVHPSPRVPILAWAVPF